jgi:hypothetical protein
MLLFITQKAAAAETGFTLMRSWFRLQHLHRRSSMAL